MHLHRLALLALLLLPVAARADRGEWYTQLEFAPSAVRLEAPGPDTSAAWRFLPSLNALVHYGLTHELTVGGTVGIGYGRNLLLQGVALQLPEGSRPRGDLYEDLLALSLAGVASYRLDTGLRVAPVARLELGLSADYFHNRAFFPAGTSLELPQDATFDVAPYARLVLGAEYRIADHWTAFLGAGARREVGGRTPWCLEASLAAAFLWW